MMEVSIFTRPKMIRVLKRFVEMRLHVDDKNEELAQKFKDYRDRLVNNRALPVYAVIDPDEPDRHLGKYIGADLSGSDFKKFLEEVLASRG